MKVTHQGLVEFATVLTWTDLRPYPGHLSAECGDVGRQGMPDDAIESLAVFEGALAWETDAPRSAVPSHLLPWAADAWLSGWDWAEAAWGHQAVTAPGREGC